MKKILIILGVLLLLLFSAGVFAYYKYLYTKPLSKAELAELTPDWDQATGGNWSPWYELDDGTKEWNPTRSFNAWVDSTPEDERAWAVLVDVYYKHKTLLRESNDLGSLPPEMQDWDSLRAMFEEPVFVDDLDRLVEAFTRPVLGAKIYGYSDFGRIPDNSNATFDPIVFEAMQKWGVENPRLIDDADTNPALLGISSIALSEHRSLIRLAQNAAIARFESGDVSACIETLDAVSTSSRLHAGFPTLISQLVANAIEANVNRNIAYLLMTGQDKLSEQDLVALDAILQRHQQRTYVWQGEALGAHDTIRRMTSASGDYSLRSMGSTNLTRSVPCDLPDARLGDNAQRMLHTINMNEQSVDGMLPWDDSRNKPLRDKVNNAKISITVSMMLEIHMTQSDHIGGSFRSFRQECIALRLALAIERHRLRHGEYPTSIGSIDQDLMGFEPIDAFGGLLTYAVTDTGPMIYSKSDDRDDDGGATMLKYDIDALLGTSPEANTQMMSRYKKSNKDSTGIRERPLWITPERVKEIEAVEPKAVDGDWVLYPITLREPEPMEDDDYDD